MPVNRFDSEIIDIGERPNHITIYADYKVVGGKREKRASATFIAKRSKPGSALDKQLYDASVFMMRSLQGKVSK